MQYLKQSTAVTLKLGPFVDETDGFTAETGLTISQADVRLSMNGGNMAQKTESTACTHDEIGIYDCPVDTTDTGTLGRLVVFVHESGARPVRQEYMVVPANVYDALCSTDKLQVDAVEVSGDSTAADDLELLVENAKGADHKVLVSTDAQDLSATLDVNTKTITADAVDANAVKTDAADKIADEVLKEVVADHDGTSGSFAELLRLVAQAAGNGKVITDTSDDTIKIYDTDGSTVLKTWTKSTAGTETTWTPS